MTGDASETVDVVIVGAGAIGCATAYYLSQEGLKVKLMDRDAIGSGASACATGLIGWLWAGFRQGTSFSMGRASLNLFRDLVPQLEKDTGMDLYFQKGPVMGVALDEHEEGLIKDILKWQSAEMEAHWLSPEDALKKEPRLSSSILGAGLVPDAAQIDSYRLTLALAQAAEKLGAEILLREVTGIQHQNGKVSGVTYDGGAISCDTVILAMGASGKTCQKWLDFPVGVRPIASQRLILEFEGPPLPAFLVSPKHGHIISRGDGYWSVGSTGGRDYGDEGGDFLEEEIAPPASDDAMMFLIERAMNVIPSLENARVADQISGWYPASADREPMIGPVPGWDGLQLAVGHTFKGIHLAPVTGSILRDYVVHGTPRVDFDLDTVRPSRFADNWNPEFASGITYLHNRDGQA